MRYFALMLAFTVVYAQDLPSEIWAGMSWLERAEVRASYDYGMSTVEDLPTEVGLTMAATCAHESRGGRWPVRIGEKEKSFGNHHLGAYYAACRVYGGELACPVCGHIYSTKATPEIISWKCGNCKKWVEAAFVPTAWQQSRTAERLLFERDFDRLHTRMHLQEIIDRLGEDWVAIWDQYNGGNGKYARQIKMWVRFLKTQFK